MTTLQQRNLGISTSSTTSRSTCKTGSSSNYLRSGDMSTSTASQSSYNSRNVVGKSPYTYNGSEQPNQDQHPARRASEEGEDSNNSEGQRSLDLASSHSSDDDETVTTRSLSLNRNLKGSFYSLFKNLFSYLFNQLSLLLL